MPVRTARVTAAIGLHAREAAVFVRAVIDSGEPVTISKPGHAAVDARSLLAVMSQDFVCGCPVELAINDGEATPGVSEAVLERLVELLGPPNGLANGMAAQEPGQA